MTTHVHQFLCLEDNYGVLIHNSGTGATAAIDAPDANAVIAAAQSRGWKLTDLLITHHHADHTQGIPGLKARYPDLRIVGPAKEASRIASLDVQVKEGAYAHVGDLEAKVIETPGHTAGHIAYWFEEDEIAFCGDTLFALGCGRVFETPMSVMWDSLVKLAALPGETAVYCGHEYTAANAKFALTIEPDNGLLRRPGGKDRHLARFRKTDGADDDISGTGDQPIPARRAVDRPGRGRNGGRRSGVRLRRNPRTQGSVLNRNTPV